MKNIDYEQDIKGRARKNFFGAGVMHLAVITYVFNKYEDYNEEELHIASSNIFCEMRNKLKENKLGKEVFLTEYERGGIDGAINLLKTLLINRELK